jgi:site-specific DNA recombinase
VIERLRADSGAPSALAELAERVELSRDGIRVSIKVPLLPTDDRNGANAIHLALTRFVPVQMKRRGVEMRMVLEGDSSPSRIDLPLIKAVACARRWSDDLISGHIGSVDELAKREGLDRRSVRRLMPLGFLSPKVVEAIVKGRQPPDLSVIALTRRIDLPLLWSAGTGARSPLVASIRIACAGAPANFSRPDGLADGPGKIARG